MIIIAMTSVCCIGICVVVFEPNTALVTSRKWNCPSYYFHLGRDVQRKLDIRRISAVSHYIPQEHFETEYHFTFPGNISGGTLQGKLGIRFSD